MSPRIARQSLEPRKVERHRIDEKLAMKPTDEYPERFGCDITLEQTKPVRLSEGAYVS